MSAGSLDTGLERVAAGDRFADYCLWPYEPVSRAEGKLRSAALLWESLRQTGADPRIAQSCERLRAGLGPFRTVWGVKQFEQRYSYEFYFYDYERLSRDVSVARVLEALSPLVTSRLHYPDGRPYFMFSLDLNNALFEAGGSLDEISVYLGNPGSSVSSGICYNLSAAGLRLDNFYFFFDAAQERDDIEAKVACSAHMDLPAVRIDEILWPELRDCGVIVVANKRLNDGVYFSRIRVDQLIAFLKRTHYPADLIAFVERNRSDLDHLLYDVGIDYRKTTTGLQIVKSAFYGLL